MKVQLLIFVEVMVRQVKKCNLKSLCHYFLLLSAFRNLGPFLMQETKIRELLLSVAFSNSA